MASWYTDICEPEKVVSSVPKFSGTLPPTSLLSSKPLRPQTKKAKVHESRIRVRTAWTNALGPLKSLLFNVFVSYMSGNSLQIFNITVTVYMFFIGPFNLIRTANSLFSPLQGKSVNKDINAAKIVYILCNLIAMAFGVWKINKLGILPTRQADWVPFEDPPKFYIL